MVQAQSAHFYYSDKKEQAKDKNKARQNSVHVEATGQRYQTTGKKSSPEAGQKGWSKTQEVNGLVLKAITTTTPHKAPRADGSPK